MKPNQDLTVKTRVGNNSQTSFCLIVQQYDIQKNLNNR